MPWTGPRARQCPVPSDDEFDLFVSDRLPRRSAEQLRDHCSECPACHRRLEQTRRFWTRLLAMRMPAPAPETTPEDESACLVHNTVRIEQSCLGRAACRTFRTMRVSRLPRRSVSCGGAAVEPASRRESHWKRCQVLRARLRGGSGGTGAGRRLRRPGRAGDEWRGRTGYGRPHRRGRGR